jgi:4-hydroxyphenylpyruvate dioxygenase
MLSWLLFYTSLLEMKKSPAQVVIDPGGVVQSQAIQSEDGAFRLALNASQSRRTLAARFLSEAFGSGVQHAALATDDILATATRMRAAGIEFLPIPENYYDDLESRADLTEDLIQQLRTYDILYDRDEMGEFFQMYTKALLDGGFFFEIVERRRYGGFGAVNAPIRLAAQTRLARPLDMPRR